MSADALGLDVLWVCFHGGMVVSLLLLPIALHRWPQVKESWNSYRAQALGIAVLGPLSYLLILHAMSFTPVSYVAPAREISILIGAFLGTRLLGEAHSVRRLVAAAVMVLGVIALAVG